MEKMQNRFVRLRLHISNKVGRPLNTTQLAEELGVSRSLLSMVESGERPASSNLALRFQKKFGIDPNWVRGGLGPAPWETYEDQHVFNSIVVDQKREDGEYPDDPIEKAGLVKRYIDQIADDPRAGIILDHLIEASRDKYYQYTLYKGLAGGFVALQSDRDDLKKMVAALRQKIRIGEEQYYDEKRKNRKLKKELAELRESAADTEQGNPADELTVVGSYNKKSRPNLRMTADNGTATERYKKLLDQAIEESARLREELEEERRKRIPDLDRYRRNKETINWLRENYPEVDISERDEEDFCELHLGFSGGVSKEGVLGEIERLRERRRLVSDIKDLFGQEPHVADRLRQILEGPEGTKKLKQLLFDGEQ